MVLWYAHLLKMGAGQAAAGGAGQGPSLPRTGAEDSS